MRISKVASVLALIAALAAPVAASAQLMLTGLGSPSVAAAGPPYVLAAGQTTSSTTASITATASAPAGTLVVFSAQNVNAPSSVTDSAGNAYALAGLVVGGNPQQSRMYFAFISNPIVSGSTVFRVNLGVATAPNVVVSAIPTALAADLAGAADPANPHNGGGGTGTSFSLTIPLRNSASEIMIAHVWGSAGIAAAPSVSGWTLLGESHSSGTNGLAQYYKDVSVTTADASFTAAFTTSSVWGTQYSTFTR